LDGICTLQIFEALGGEAGALAPTAEVEQKQDDGEGDEGGGCGLPWPPRGCV
jgi:hypothetical protein